MLRASSSGWLLRSPSSPNSSEGDCSRGDACRNEGVGENGQRIATLTVLSRSSISVSPGPIADISQRPERYRFTNFGESLFARIGASWGQAIESARVVVRESDLFACQAR